MVILVIRLDFVVDREVDVVWRGLHSPTAAGSIYAPVFRMDPVGPVPDRWTDGGAATMSLRLFGLVPLGRSVIRTFDHQVEFDGDTVRVFQDAGGPVSGPMTLLRSWNHRMAVNSLPDGRTRWRDRLEIGGTAAFLFYPALWLTWQWRRFRIRRAVLDWT